MRSAARPDGEQLLTAGPSLEGTAARTVQLWPHIHGTDAMFFALLQKQPE